MKPGDEYLSVSAEASVRRGNTMVIIVSHISLRLQKEDANTFCLPFNMRLDFSLAQLLPTDHSLPQIIPSLMSHSSHSESFRVGL